MTRVRSLPHFFALGICTALTALAPLRAQSGNELRIELGGGQAFELIRIDPGTFQQGSPPGAPGRGADETQHKVTLTRPFLLGKYPVTRGQFTRFVAETKYRTDAESGPSGGFGWDGAQLVQRKEFTWRNPGFAQTDDHPVTLVTYRDAGAFLQWLSRRAGRTFALPSEAQWEYAAHAGSTSEPIADAVAWHKGDSSNATHPVGQKAPNAWGLGDMLGNVWEWCEDWYAPYPPGDAVDPLQRNSSLSDKPRRVLRGGSWMREAKFSRPATRYRNDAMSRNADNGFRVMTFQLEAPAAAAPPLAKIPNTPAYSESGRHVISTPVALPLEDQPKSMPMPAVYRKPSGFGLEWGLIIPLVIMVIYLLRSFFRAFTGAISTSSGSRFSGGSSAAPGSGDRYMPGQPLRVRIADDGFWIMGDGIAGGSPMACRYELDGHPHQLDVRYEAGPDGQFVFTGGRPANVSVSLDPGAGPLRSMTTGMSTSRPLVDNDPPFRGHPSAY